MPPLEQLALLTSTTVNDAFEIVGGDAVATTSASRLAPSKSENATTKMVHGPPCGASMSQTSSLLFSLDWQGQVAASVRLNGELAGAANRSASPEPPDVARWREEIPLAGTSKVK